MILSDVGQTFGGVQRRGRGAINFKAWSHTPIWKDTAGCAGTLARPWSVTLHDPVIGASGRAFLAELP